MESVESQLRAVENVPRMIADNVVTPAVPALGPALPSLWPGITCCILDTGPEGCPAAATDRAHVPAPARLALGTHEPGAANTSRPGPTLLTLTMSAK
jgi:hypothetical protein